MVLKERTKCSKDYDSPQGRFKGQIDDSPRVTGLLSMQSRVRSPPWFYFICRASRQPITRAESKFVARQLEASVVIPAAKLEFVAESRTRVYFAQHVA